MRAVRRCAAGGTLWLLIGGTSALASALDGHVVDSNGEIAGAVEVSVPSLHRQVWSDELGRFRMSGLPAGRMVIQVGGFNGWSARRDTVWLAADSVTHVTLVSTCVGPSGLAPRLPIQESDFRKYPRHGFAFSYSTSWGEKVNSAAGLATREGSLAGVYDENLNIALSDAELDDIYLKVIEIRFFDLNMPSSHDSWPPSGRRVWGSQHVLSVQAGSARWILVWETAGRPEYPSQGWKRIDELVELIRRSVRAHSEFWQRSSRDLKL